MTWWTGAALGFDCESDGPEPTEARIITMATTLITPGNAPQEIEVMVQPERDIPQRAIDVHGITTERARDEGLSREAGIAQVALTIAELASADAPLVGHNVSYDLTLLDREMRRLDIGRLSTNVDTGFVSLRLGSGYGQSVTSFPVIDTYVLDKGVDRYRKGKRKLEPTAAHYGVPMAEGSAHGAQTDVLASLRIAWKIHQRCLMAADYVAQNGSDPMVFRMHPFMRYYAGRRDPLELVKTFADLGMHSIRQVHEIQRVWALEQAKGLREYFMTSGTGDPETVDGRWPVRPLDESGPVETVDTELI